MNFIKRKIVRRLILDAAMAVALLCGWWMVLLPLAVAGSWSFPFFAETVVAGLAFDSLFGLNRALPFFGLTGTAVSILILIAVFLLKKVVRD